MSQTDIQNENTVSVEQTENCKPGISDQQSTKPQYEVVFFIRYPYGTRPSSDTILSFFSNYGKVDHVDDPKNRDFAYVFMHTLSTTVEHRRTRTTITEIINNMTPETKFYITVASSNRNQSRFRHGPSRYHRGNYRHRGNSNNRYRDNNQSDNNQENIRQRRNFSSDKNSSDNRQDELHQQSDRPRDTYYRGFNRRHNGGFNRNQNDQAENSTRDSIPRTYGAGFNRNRPSYNRGGFSSRNENQPSYNRSTDNTQSRSNRHTPVNTNSD